MKTIAETLGVARSNLIERRDDAKPKRGPQDRPGDFELSADIRRLVDQRPTYGYRRIAALSASGDPTAWPRSTPSASTG